MPTQRDVQRLQALREARRRGMLGPTQSAAAGVLENRFSEYFKGVGGRAKSVAEPAMTMASSMVAEPLSGLAGIAGTILPGPQGQGADWVERTQDALTYMPRSESGMQGLQGLASLMQPVGDAMQAAERGAGDFGYERFGPGVGAMMAAIPAGIAEAAGVGKPGRIAKKFGSASDLMTEWNSRGIKSFVSERPDKLVLDKIIVPDGARGQGLGSQAMEELAEYADQTGKRIELSPSADFGGNKKRLTEFYKRQGFVENKGKNKDFEISESMYRPAKSGGSAEPVGNLDDLPGFKEGKWAKLDVGPARLEVKDVGDGIKIGNAMIRDNAKRGKGFGVAAYEDLIVRAKRQGKKFIQSDETVEVPAARVYESLDRKGYKIKRDPTARKVESKRGEDFWTADDDRPPFVIELD